MASLYAEVRVNFEMSLYDVCSLKNGFVGQRKIKPMRSNKTSSQEETTNSLGYFTVATDPCFNMSLGTKISSLFFSKKPGKGFALGNQGLLKVFTTLSLISFNNRSMRIPQYCRK